ncbi:MAG: hypothetical protein WC979_05545 [Candidatus Pacearchaeota archaeon]|jgi:hypothetical protein
MAIVLKYVSDGEDYLNNFLIDKIRKHKGKICYITLNQSCVSLKKILTEKGIDTQNIYFIDGVTKLSKEPPNNEKCRFVLPYQINDMERYALECIKDGCNLIIFDSLSNLTNYQQYIPAGADIMTNSINFLNNELDKNKGEAIFICNLSDKNNLLIEETTKIFKICNYGKGNTSCEV